MPIYVYKCNNCGEKEIEHKITEGKEKCPDCGIKLTRVMGAPAFIVRGDNAANSYGLKSTNKDGK